IYKQMNKLIEVVKVKILQPESATMRELALVKVTIKDDKERQSVMSLNEIFRNRVIDITPKSMTLEVVGSSDKIDSFVGLASERVHVSEVARSGTVALYRGDDSISLD
ncbi:MAG: acetolactate synthase small subunit, partial [SAR324 cluster bacterium]|nr:acetolactate synthase small subunit [SAR324 cluster bacterium]